MINTTALFTEFLVIGTAAWLWITPLIQLMGGVNFIDLVAWFDERSTLLLGIVALATYALGVLTESLSFALEKIAVGPTSDPRRWYKEHIADLSSEDWHAAQERIWKSEPAYSEFIYSRLRVTISRGIFTNSIIGSLMLAISFIFTVYPSFSYMLVSSLVISIFSLMSWWFATLDYTARVRVAGVIEEE